MSSSHSISQKIARFFSIHYKTTIAIKRTYDNFAIKQFWNDWTRKRAVRNQTVDMKAHSELGSDLAVANFVLSYCGGSVRNANGVWIRNRQDLPKEYIKSFRVTAIHAAKGDLLAEGIDNFVGLDYIESLDLSDNPKLDDFACDQLSRQLRKSRTLREINLSHNPLVSVYGLEILFRIPTLKRIVAINTQASDFDDIDLFTMAAKDEKQCDVLVHESGKKYKLDELNDLEETIETPLLTASAIQQ